MGEFGKLPSGCARACELDGSLGSSKGMVVGVVWGSPEAPIWMRTCLRARWELWGRLGKSASSHVDAHVLASYMGAWGVGRGWVAGVVWSSPEATMWMRTCGGGRRVRCRGVVICCGCCDRANLARPGNDVLILGAYADAIPGKQMLMRTNESDNQRKKNMKQDENE